ncbi:MAG: 2-C-methyl-D-erythritol 4-phosphate cytidylyltransferase [Lachnospiraceae bacterium]|nr:2-C-methyl-D-erythritol 4-phosphate cytidylyltransferase [Lachnospiraceae bacterium]
MVTALIFAGGTGKRMNSRSKPKQFLEMHGKPIIIYTLEHFEYHNEIEQIVIVCLADWIEELKGMLKRYGITKVVKIVPGGETGHDSIYNGLNAMQDNTKENDIVLIHDGVRPLINDELITQNIEAVRKYGNAITAEASRESVVRSEDGQQILEMPSRDQMYIAKAPQSFYYGDIMEVYEKAQSDGRKSIDSSHLCSMYGVPLFMIPSTKNNIKITEPADYYVYKALYEALEGQQIFGL